MLHIGKTGGVALKVAIRKYRRSGTYAIYKHGHDWTLRELPEGDKFFFFVRHPVSRFVSAFIHVQLQSRPRFFEPWSPGEAIAFSRFHSANELALALSSEVSSRREEAIHAMRNISHIRDSLYDWLDSDAALLRRAGDVLFIGFQEDMTADFEALKKRLGLLQTASLPRDDVKSNRNPEGSDTHLEEEARANLCKWYARDIHLYELCKGLRRQIDYSA